MSVINDALKKASKEKKEVFSAPPKVSPPADQKPVSPADHGPAGPVKDYGSSTGFRPASGHSNRFEKWIMLLLFGVVILLVSMGFFLTREFFFKTEEAAVPSSEIVQDKPVRKETVPKEPVRGVYIPDETVPDKPAPPEVVPAETVKEIPGEEDFGEVPGFSLTGIVFGGGEPSAIINSKIVKEGDVIQGAKVLEIKPKTVILSFKGKEISLSY